MMLEVTPKQGCLATYLELQDGYKNMIMQWVQNTADALSILFKKPTCHCIKKNDYCQGRLVCQKLIVYK